MVDAAQMFRRLPRMDELLDYPRVLTWMGEADVSREFVREAATHVLDELRQAIAAHDLSEEALEKFLEDPAAAVVLAAEALAEPHLRRVVNGTGVVVHTNLGRSPWPARAAQRVAELATCYTNLEFDLDEGGRGGRERPVSRFLERLLPGVAVAVVNNNAAAVLLVLNTFAQGREVIVSRGELVEIGGSFRIPQIMAKGFCKLREVGTLTAGEMDEISGGLTSEPLTITINKRLFDYDLVAILGPVVPHETAGFAGGNKYFFPGVAGTEIISSFHWIGALITNQVINGLKDNPVGRILDKGADFLTFNKLCFSFVVQEDGELACLFIGSPEESWSRAVDYSARIHITYKNKPYRRILGLAPAMYDDLWVGGKVMYKLEPIVADGGELVIYAPHIKALSHAHEAAIREMGYHVPEYFLKQWDRFAQASRLIMAHSTNVKGGGSYDDGVERPRVKVTLATGIPEELCRQVNLGYVNPYDIDVSEWRQQEADGVLVVEHAGQVLYRLKSS